MKKEIKETSKKVAYGLAIAGVVVGLVGAYGYISLNKSNGDLAKTLGESQAKIVSLNSQLDDSKITEQKFKEELEAIGIQVVKLSEERDADKQIIADYEAELKVMQDEKTAAEEQVIAETTKNVFKEDKLALDYSGTLTLDDNDLTQLGDYTIDFDGEDIDVKETLMLKGAFSSNDKDFEGETMYKLSEDDLAYTVSLDTDMTALDYSEDDVTIQFLGQPMKITSWDAGKVVVDSALEVDLANGESYEDITLVKIGESAVLIKHDDKIKTIKEGDSYDFGDVEVEVDSIFYTSSDATENLAVLKIGKDVSETIKDGDDYAADENYKWVITSDSIGLTLQEDFDEDDTALTAGASFALPKDFAKVSFELSDEKMNDLEVEYKSATEVEFKGDFEDAVGPVVFNGTVFIDHDDDVYTSIQLKDSDYSLEFDGTDFVVGDVKISAQVDSVLVNGVDYTTKDYDVKSTIGIVVSAPENDLDDGQLSLSVPEEKIEATILVE